MPPRRRLPLCNKEEESINDGDGGDVPPPPPPPPILDMAQFWANATQLMAAMPRQGKQNDTIGCSSASFFRQNSPVFDGSEGPMEADDWITNFKDLVNALRCTDS
jgi:hypothetical protein